MVFVLLVFYTALAVWETWFLGRQRRWRELAVAFFLLAAGAFYGLGQVLDFPLPNPTLLIEAVLAPVAQLLDRTLVSR